MKEQQVLFGKSFNYWTVLDEKKIKNYIVYYLCKCECGKVKYVNKHSLTSGKSKSCGCYAKEQTKKRMTTHNLSKTVLYRRWKGIRRRCYSVNSTKYYMYGAKGIKMCDEWKNNFLSFYEWSMQNGFRPELTIDRIDYNGDYYPENCRWADVYTQSNNRKNIKRYKIDNNFLTLSEISEKYKINLGCLQNRVRKLKWDINKAINTPAEKGRNQFTELNNTKNIDFKGEKISFNELCERSNLSKKIIRSRLNKSWSVEEILNTPKGCHHNKKGIKGEIL